ncbi:glutamate--tRNA ligase [Acanthopleuribacter pedis]|uniref:Glutamate--tRNA ligase n=1 Tax=Acanthopleuribacter pedis TaxID=442870 RepID=A0A8J7U5J7_9BACT|nr:glutamate--tRNA ligase [Acanthopleuribacter pedis]MBO1320924.1 glutamate--tRNA ligase [Acanthopleuribacter pedis]
MSDSPIRVRIAPSPTGSPHVGTAYIALYNYCFAKAGGGSFILRIEDTDQSRSKPEYETMILDALRWTGLQWDEGPDVGGDYGPYRQSERTDIYREHAQTLIDNGHAYKCFCTEERLNALREAQRQAGGNMGYDGHCATLSAEEIKAQEDAGTPFTVRMQVPREGQLVVNDTLRGDITFDLATIDHQILLKSDGFPTYHLANVVDDHLMKITHVLRGEEWLPSLPKHVLLYQYFGWEPTQVIHLPLLRNADGSKLSKRKNPTSILYYRDMGIIPEALVNFLGNMAYSQPDGSEIFALEKMVADFDIKRISLGGPIFDMDKLTWVNGQHLQALPAEELVARLMGWRFNETFLQQLMPMMTKRLTTLGDFTKYCDIFFLSQITVDKETIPPKGKEAEDTRDFLQKFIWELETLVQFDREAIEQAFRIVGDIHGWSMRETTHAVRLAVTGKTVVPPLFDSMAIIGSDVCRNRMMAAVTQLGPLGKKKLKKLRESWDRARAAVAGVD